MNAQSNEKVPAKKKVNDAWTDYDPPWVEPDGAIPFRYRVESKSEPDVWHVVDLTDRGGQGACSCKHFQTVANPNFRRHGQWIPYAPKRHGVSECKHIAAAFAHFHLHVAVPMLAKMRNGVPAGSQP